MNAQSQTTEEREFTLKPLSKDGIEAALSKAEHYRLLNQPLLAESICLDILDVEPDHQMASRVLLLALTDQFAQSSAKAKQAHEIAKSLKSDYEQLYYTGIIHERLGNAALTAGTPGSNFDAYEWYIEAMEFFEKADEVNQDARNDDPVLRWNTCARIIMEHRLERRPQDDTPLSLE